MFRRLVDAVLGHRRSERAQNDEELGRLQVEADAGLDRAKRALAERERVAAAVRNTVTALRADRKQR